MTEPGWYTDPRDSSQYRYWDGTSWTEAVAPGAAAESFAGAADGHGSEATSAVADAASGAADAVADQAGSFGEAASDNAGSFGEAVSDHAGSFGDAVSDHAGSFGDAVSDRAGSFGDAVSDRAGSFGDATDKLPGSFGSAADQASDQFDQAASGLTNRADGTADGVGGSVAAAFESAATAIPVDAPPAFSDNAAGAIQETAASAIPIENSTGLSVDEALLDLNPGENIGNGPSLDGVGQGISVDDVLNDVDAPFSDAAETMVVDVPDFADAPALGDVGVPGVPGDGRSFSSPIDTFGGADETAVISGTDLPLADPSADRFGAPPPSPTPPGFDPNSSLPPAPGFDQRADNNPSNPGFAPPPGGGTPPSGFDSPPPDQFGQPGPGGPGGPGFDPGNPGFGEPEGPRPLAPPPVAPSKSRTPWIVLGIIGLAIVAVLAFLALRSPGRTSVDAIAEGQCFADFDQFEATEIRSSVSSADCLEEHALEVFEVTDDPYLDFSDYPGEQVITDLAFRHCLDGFEAFVGTTYEESTLDVWALYPTEGSWNLNNDREVVCMVGAFDQSLTTGSLQGSGR